jgi:integrase
MFNLAIDSKLRGCDLIALRFDDVLISGRIRPRAVVLQKKTDRPVQFEITEQTRDTVLQWIKRSNRKPGEYLFPSRIGKNKPLTVRHYSRLMDGWVGSIGLDAALYGTHSLRRTKVALIYRRTGNLRAVQLLLGHTKLESTVRYLGTEVDDALAIAEQIDI